MQQEIETENWRVIVRDPKYMVSDLGRVKNIKKRKIMKISPNNKGYLMVTLSNNG